MDGFAYTGKEVFLAMAGITVVGLVILGIVVELRSAKRSKKVTLAAHGSDQKSNLE